METTLFLIVWIGVWLLIGFLFAKLFFAQRIKSHRQQAVNQSRSTTLGYVSEAIAPLLPNFPYHYKDMVFLGKWVDYLVFDGLHRGELTEIIFLEIKTNTSQLNKNEKLIKQAIDAWSVSHRILRISQR